MKLILAFLVAAFALSSTADAGNVHLKRKPALTFNDLGLSLNASGALTGLGNGDIVILLTANADVISTCTNPSGNTQPPGQNPAPITVSGSQAIPQDQIKNGNVGFNVVTQAPASIIPGAPDCPNPQWTEAIEDLQFTQATITVQQPAPTVVFTLVCTIDPPSEDGVIPRRDVSCQ